MTDEKNIGPTLEQLHAIETELGDMLVDYFATREIPPAVGVSILSSLVGRGLGAFSAPEDLERSLAMIFKSIRFRAIGDKAAAGDETTTH